jgi:hypothetical protein
VRPWPGVVDPRYEGFPASEARYLQKCIAWDVEVGGSAAGLVLLLLVLGGTWFVLPDSSMVAAPEWDGPSALVQRDPIRIVGNANFTAANGVVRGAGTPSDPFVIEGWTIDAGSQDGVHIEDTRAHLLIQDVEVNGSAGTYEGLFLWNVSNAILRSLATHGNRLGILVYEGANLTIESSESFANDVGVSLNGATDVRVAGNLIAGNAGAGLFAAAAERVLVVDNDIVGNGAGMHAASPSGIRTVGNSFAANRDWDAITSLPSANAWDDGYPAGGNYWANYSGTDECRGAAQDDCSAPDGIGDVPHGLPGGDSDRYPLIAPRRPVPLPHAAYVISPEHPVVGWRVTFDGTLSNGTGGPIRDYAWDFGDGGSQAGAVVQHVYATPGTYVVSLTVWDAHGLTATRGGPLRVGIPMTTVSHPSGFAIPVPTGWEVQQDEDLEGFTVELVVRGPFGDGFQTNVIVETDRDPSVRETDAYMRSLYGETVAGVTADDPAAYVSEGPVYRTIGNHSAVVFELRYTNDVVIQRMAMVVSDPHDRYWVILLSTTPSYYDVGTFAFEDMLEGFQVTAAPPLDALGVVVGAGLVGALIAAVIVLVLWVRHKRRPAPPVWMGPTGAPAGAPIPSTGATPSAAAVPICRFCGKPGMPAARFCARCGAPFPLPPPQGGPPPT